MLGKYEIAVATAMTQLQSACPTSIISNGRFTRCIGSSLLLCPRTKQFSERLLMLISRTLSTGYEIGYWLLHNRKRILHSVEMARLQSKLKTSSLKKFLKPKTRKSKSIISADQRRHHRPQHLRATHMTDVFTCQRTSRSSLPTIPEQFLMKPTAIQSQLSRHFQSVGSSESEIADISIVYLFIYVATWVLRKEPKIQRCSG